MTERTKSDHAWREESGAGRAEDGYLTGQILIAMPSMQDERFQRSVIYMCAHGEDGAMGLVINKLLGSLSFSELLEQLDIELEEPDQNKSVHFGGPVDTGRGFVLHSADYVQEETMLVDPAVGLTATVDILRDIALGKGPERSILALGYAGWGPGQLDAEIQANGWLSCKPDSDLLFEDDIDSKWDKALAKLGISAHLLSGEAGHA